MVRVLLLSLLVLAAPIGCKKDEPSSSILLITIDTLRADHLGAYGYFRETSPRIDAFAEESILFENAITPMATTLPAHVSMLTSTPPLRHGVVRNGLVFDPEPDLMSIAQMLSARGYDTAAFVSAAPIAKASGIAAGFAEFSEPPPDQHSQRGELTTDAALAWFDAHKKSERPFFVWIHLFDPHNPYEPPEEYAKMYTDSDELVRWVKATGASPKHKHRSRTYDVLDINNRYDGEVRYTDAQVGRIFDRLTQLGLYEESTIVFAADHGEGLWQHDWHDHGEIWNEQLFVPLIVKPPQSAELEPRRIESLASTMDIVPTLDGMLELPLTEEQRAQLDGVDLLQDRRTLVFSERVDVHRRGWVKGEKYALTTADWKLFSLTEADDQLFDMRQDRHELKDVIEEHPDVAVSLKRQINSIIAGYRAKNTAPRRSADSAQAEKLRALGYLE